MLKKESLPLILSVALLVCISAAARGQALYKVSTEEKISRSALVIEGKVVGKSSFWNAERTMIYTTNKVEIYKVFKGSVEKSVVDIITVGGSVDNHYIHASHLLQLDINDVGVFFCAPSTRSRGRFQVYSSSQGFLKYNLRTKKAVAPFVEFRDIEKNLYPELNRKIGQRIEIRNPAFSVEKESRERMIRSNGVLTPTITSFSPTTVNAGAILDEANNILTITGSGFGTAAGDAAVLFPDVDQSPGSEYEAVEHNSPLILSWSDNQIRVRVPSRAGTGAFRVRDSGGNEVGSPNDLHVFFSILTAELSAPYGIKQFNLGNRNGSGGYTIKYSTSTANGGVNINASPAKATFVRALTSWINATGVNFVEGGVSANQKVDTDDNDNLIMFDNGGTGVDPLDAGVLATCYSGITICTNSAANQALKNGFDIVVRNTGFSEGSTAFTFGPCPPYSLNSSAVDLESVLLHELGHAMNLGHIREPLEGTGPAGTNPAKVMNYSVSMNHRRISIDNAARAGAAYQITQHNRSYGTCVPTNPEMTAVQTALEPKDDCPATFPTSTTPNNTAINFDLSLTTSNRDIDPGYQQMTLNGTGTNITNTAFYVVRTNSSGGDITLEVKNYATVPVDIAACPSGSTGIDVSGVKLSVYKVSSCPGGGNFPAPVYYQVFDKNIVLPELSNLSSSSHYLVVVDGVQNTKARFDLVIRGSAVVDRITTLEGNVFETYNLLSWETDTVFDIASMKLERSGDGVQYDSLAGIEGDAQRIGNYTDANPLSGDNYYRLAITNTNGTVDYTDVVLLSRSGSFTVAVKDNPVRTGMITVIVNSTASGRYGFNLVNSMGQTVFSTHATIAGGRQLVNLQVPGLRNGTYFLAVFDEGGKRIKSTAITVAR